jgi:hypothetical protein
VLCLPEKFDASLKPLTAALSLRTRFEREYEAFDKKKKEIGRRFQRIFAQRKADMLTRVEEDPQDVRPKIRRGIVSELLETFP